MPRLETNNNGIKSVQIKIKAFLHRQSWKEALIFFLFLLLALGFWILQSMNEEYETEMSIPVRFKDIPADVAFTQPPPEQITISIKDKGNVLLNYSLTRIFSPLDVVYKNALNNNGLLVVPKQEIESHIQKQLLSSTVLNSYTPNRIEIQTSKKKQKQVPIVFNGVVTYNDGYGLAGKITLSPSAINIYSTQNILDSISEIRTNYFEIKNAKKSISRTLTLESVSGVTFDQQTVSISIPIEEFTEKTLDIPVVCTGIPHNFIVRTFPPSIKVNANIPLSKYKELTEDDFSIRVKYEDLEQHLSGSFPIELERSPDWIHAYGLVPDKIEFIIEQVYHD